MPAFVLGSLATASRPIVGGTSPKPRHACGLPVALTTVHSRMVGGSLVSLSARPLAVSPGGANVRSILTAAAMGSPTSSSNPQLPRLIHTEDPSVPVDPKHPELVKLRSEGGRMHRACLLGCGGQALLGLAAGGSMAVSLMGGGSVAPTAQLLALGVCTAVGLALGALSLGVYGRLFLGASRDLEAGVVVPPSLISGNLVRCMAWNVAGAAVCALGLQLAVSGGLMTVPFSPAASANALVALDHMAVQAASLMLLSHLSSLAYLNLMFKYIRAARYPSGGLALGSYDGISPH